MKSGCREFPTTTSSSCATDSAAAAAVPRRGPLQLGLGAWPPIGRQRLHQGRPMHVEVRHSHPWHTVDPVVPPVVVVDRHRLAYRCRVRDHRIHDPDFSGRSVGLPVDHGASSEEHGHKEADQSAREEMGDCVHQKPPGQSERVVKETETLRI